MPFMVSPEEAARAIADGMAKDKAEIVFPLPDDAADEGRPAGPGPGVDGGDRRDDPAGDAALSPCATWQSPALVSCPPGGDPSVRARDRELVDAPSRRRPRTSPAGSPSRPTSATSTPRWRPRAPRVRAARQPQRAGLGAGARARGAAPAGPGDRGPGGRRTGPVRPGRHLLLGAGLQRRDPGRPGAGAPRASGCAR